MDSGVLRRSRADAAASSSAATDAACSGLGPSSSSTNSASAAPDCVSPVSRPRHPPGGAAAQRRNGGGGGGNFAAAVASALCLAFLTVLLLGVPGPAHEPPPHRYFTHEGSPLDGAPLTAEDRARLASRPGNRSQRPQNDPFWQTLANVTVVYTWVNGSDPLFQGQRRSQGNRGGESRYRETGELAHSVRSLERFLPWWTGDLVMVTPNGVWPRQLSRTHPRLRVVDQYDILPKEAAPAFNSAVFEQRLHLVPGLSDVFIHMNDDYLVGRLTHPSDFFTDDGGPRLYFETSVVRGRRKQHLDLRRERRKLWLASVFNTVATATEKLGDRRTHHFVKHAPFVYSRAALLRMHDLFGDELKAGLAHRFRSHDDVLTPFLHHITLMELGMEEGTATGSGGRNAWFAALPPDEQQRRLNVTWASHSSSDQDAKLCYVRDDLRGTLSMMATHLRAPHMFIAVNDGFSSLTSGAVLRAFLQRTTPYPSAFERSAAAAAAAFGVEASYDADAAAPRWSPDAPTLVRRAARVAANKGVAGVDTYTTPDPVMVADEKRRRHWVAVARATRGYTLPAALEGPGADVPAACRTAEGQAVLGSSLLCERPLADAAPPSANKTHRGRPHCEAVDAVVFVDAAQAAGGGAAAPRSSLPSSLPQLLVDNAALRATLRSLHRNLPWLRHVWVVAEVAAADAADSRGGGGGGGGDLRPALTLLPATRADVRKRRVPAGGSAASVAHRYVAVSAGFVYTAPTFPHELAGSRLLGTRQPFFRGGGGGAAAVAPHVPVVVDTLLEEYFSGAAGGGGAGVYAHALALHRSAAAVGAEEAAAAAAAVGAGASLELGGLAGFVAKEVAAGRASAEDVACRALGVHPVRGAAAALAAADPWLRALRGCGAEAAAGAAAWGKGCLESVVAEAAAAVSRVEFGAGAAAAAAAMPTVVVPVLELGKNATKPQLDKLFRVAVESGAGAVFIKASLGEVWGVFGFGLVCCLFRCGGETQKHTAHTHTHTHTHTQLTPDEVELLTHLQPTPAPWE